ncbi:MAG: hypothetical protein ABFD54_14945 [Armatimonadota bacterium]|nr:hypothetical protein [bacterium]
MRPLLGTPCWTKRYYWSTCSGGGVQPFYDGWQKSLILRQARYNHPCRDCGHIVIAGSLHAAGGERYNCSDHYCILCVAPVGLPERKLQPGEPLPPGELLDDSPRVITDDIAPGFDLDALPHTLDILQMVYCYKVDIPNIPATCPACGQKLFPTWTGRPGAEWKCVCQNPQCLHLMEELGKIGVSYEQLS